MNNSTTEAVILFFTGGAGTIVGAAAKTFTGNRHVDKVDAVKAVSEAYNLVNEAMAASILASDKRNAAQIDRLEDHVRTLRGEIVRKDEMIERLLMQIVTIAPIAPIAPVAPVAPVAPILPLAPVDH